MRIHYQNWRIVFWAGLAGGMAEIAWVMTYSGWTGHDPLEIARQITATVFPVLAPSSFAVILGIGIHLALSLLLAAVIYRCLVGTLGAKFGNIQIIPLCLLLLFLVWSVNFLFILPILNPAFPTLMPLTVTCLSKLLFGAAMGLVFLRGGNTPRLIS